MGEQVHNSVRSLLKLEDNQMPCLRALTRTVIATAVLTALFVLSPPQAQANSLNGCGGFNFVDTLFKIRASVGSDSRTAFLLGKKWRIVYKYDEDERLFSCEYQLVDDAFKTASPEGCRDYADEVKAEIEKQRKITLLGIPPSVRLWEEIYRYPNGSEINVMFDWRDEQSGCVGNISYIKQQNDERKSNPVTF